MNINFICCNLSSNNFAADIIFFSVAFAIFESFRTIDYEGFKGLQWQEFHKRLIVLDIDIFL